MAVRAVLRRSGGDERVVLWPSGVGCRGGAPAHLSGERIVGHALKPAPLLYDCKERASVGATQHAREASAIEVDALQQLAPLANTYTALIGDVGVPDGALGVDAEIPSGTSTAMSNAFSFFPYDSAMISVELSCVTAIRTSRGTGPRYFSVRLRPR